MHLCAYKIQVVKEYFCVYSYTDIYTTGYSHLPATWDSGMMCRMHLYLQFCIQEELLWSRHPRQQASLHSQAIFIYKYDIKLIKNKNNWWE